MGAKKLILGFSGIEVSRLSEDDQCWVWYFDTKPGVPYAIWDLERTNIPGYIVSTAPNLPVSVDDAVIVLKVPGYYSSVKVSQQSILRFGSGALCAKQEVLDLIEALDPGSLEILDISVIVDCKDAQVDGFHFARPNVVVECTDLEYSEVEPLGPDGEYFVCQKLVLKKNCLGERHIVRDRYGQHIIISSKLFTALENLVPGQANVIAPSKYQS